MIDWQKEKNPFILCCAKKSVDDVSEIDGEKEKSKLN